MQFVYQGHSVKFKVTAAKMLSGVVYLRLKGSIVLWLSVLSVCLSVYLSVCFLFILPFSVYTCMGFIPDTENTYIPTYITTGPTICVVLRHF